MRGHGICTYTGSLLHWCAAAQLPASCIHQIAHTPWQVYAAEMSVSVTPEDDGRVRVALVSCLAASKFETWLTFNKANVLVAARREERLNQRLQACAGHADRIPASSI